MSSQDLKAFENRERAQFDFTITTNELLIGILNACEAETLESLFKRTVVADLKIDWDTVFINVTGTSDVKTLHLTRKYCCCNK